ncbi:hypothetical protein PV11_00389 [Exophiala sideris]|uniref:MARVEL domain-containing protein n=1 Tax=Exophiala sideris TaxID=1016849 RepID=A0A0D1X9V0_9EURO|nr:hypothetical protein PV11_00389 [Exophiala sideris]
MADVTRARSDNYLWFARLLQLIFTIAILGVTGDGASLWKSIDCDIPAKLAFNIAAAALTLPAVIYLIFCSGPKLCQKLPFNLWAVVGIDAFMFLIWLAATAASVYDCNGVCSACSPIGRIEDIGYGFWIQYDSLFCECYFPGFDYRNRHRVRAVLEGRGVSSLRNGSTKEMAQLGEKSYNIAAKRGLGVVMIFLFFTTLVAMARYLWKARKEGAATADDNVMQHDSSSYAGADVQMTEDHNKAGPTVTGNEVP